MVENKLIGLSSGIEGREFPLAGRMTIGRSDDNAIVIKEPGISRHHAELVVTGGKILIKDLGSANGSKVNGELVVNRELKSGDRIRIADVEFVYIGAAEEAPPDLVQPSGDNEQTAFIDMSAVGISKPEVSKSTAYVDMSKVSAPSSPDRTEFVDMSKMALLSPEKGAQQSVNMSDVFGKAPAQPDAGATSFVDMKELMGHQPEKPVAPAAPALSAVNIPQSQIGKPSPYVLVYKVEGKEHRYPVKVGMCTVGRDATCDLNIPDISVSPRHARFVFDGISLQVEDIGTASGVFINLEKVLAPRIVRPGDEVLIGRFSMYCRRAALEESSNVAPSETAQKTGFFRRLLRFFRLAK
ncbi:MAG: FHA domain-containing protein [Candidatus Brocadiia bacterium]